MRSRVARIHGVPRPRDRQSPRGEEASTLPTLRSQPSPFPRRLQKQASPLELPQDRRAAVNPAPMAANRSREQSPSAAHSSVRDEVDVPCADRKRKRKPKHRRALTHAHKGTQTHSQAVQSTLTRDFKL
ncbi:hypothetical protein B296_00059159 [Ensete ventricosum]|uniref:Uncharacterized protein n=1 Tax=Ensete ventricosum TaxID=4639 RepID=A0A426WV29_ENSVE|nr:hypothetical protein B296_00059159 [Ensete ventricosum]